MSTHVYVLNPIDFWDGWTKPADYISEMNSQDWLADWDTKFARAQNAALKRGWEGDIREGPYVAPLPHGDPDCTYMIGWKQDNNGTTFIASPYPLPWLDKEDMGL